MNNRYLSLEISEDEKELIDSLRCAADYMDRMINQCCPPSREKNICLEKLEECLMWANKSVAFNKTKHRVGVM